MHFQHIAKHLKGLTESCYLISSDQAEWTRSDPDTFSKEVNNFAERDNWIIDGNYSSVSEVISTKADTLIFLNYPLAIVFWRLIRRSLNRYLTQEVLWNGNKETWRALFSVKQSQNVILWMVPRHRSRRKMYLSLKYREKFPQMSIVSLKSPREAKKFLSNLKVLP